MGGQGGLSHALVGAVECQKTTAALHLHFWNFIQRAHQYLTLEEITHKLESALLKVYALTKKTLLKSTFLGMISADFYKPVIL